MAHRKVFVYGTLRPCSARWAEDGELAPPVQGTTKGALYSAGPFPYADFDGDGVITGDIITLDDEDYMFHRVRSVELNSGYVEREVIVETSVGHVVCLAFDADPRVKARTLPHYPRVKDDDWYNEVVKPRVSVW